MLGTVAGAESGRSTLHHPATYSAAAGAGGLLFFGPLLMILSRQEYPRWWFGGNTGLLRFLNRVWAFFAVIAQYPPFRLDP